MAVRVWRMCLTRCGAVQRSRQLACKALSAARTCNVCDSRACGGHGQTRHMASVPCLALNIDRLFWVKRPFSRIAETQVSKVSFPSSGVRRTTAAVWRVHRLRIPLPVPLGQAGHRTLLHHRHIVPGCCDQPPIWPRTWCSGRLRRDIPRILSGEDGVEAKCCRPASSTTQQTLEPGPWLRRTISLRRPWQALALIRSPRVRSTICNSSSSSQR